MTTYTSLISLTRTNISTDLNPPDGVLGEAHVRCPTLNTVSHVLDIGQ